MGRSGYAEFRGSAAHTRQKENSDSGTWNSHRITPSRQGRVTCPKALRFGIEGCPRSKKMGRAPVGIGLFFGLFAPNPVCRAKIVRSAHKMTAGSYAILVSTDPPSHAVGLHKIDDRNSI